MLDSVSFPSRFRPHGAGGPQTLEEFGKRFAVTKERIRRIELRAMTKLREVLDPRAADLIKPYPARRRVPMPRQWRLVRRPHPASHERGRSPKTLLAEQCHTPGGVNSATCRPQSRRYFSDEQKPYSFLPRSNLSRVCRIAACCDSREALPALASLAISEVS